MTHRNVPTPLMLFAVGVICAIGLAHNPIDLQVCQFNEKYRLIGCLGKPLGTPAKVCGVVVSRIAKESGKDLVVQRIDGRATQKDLRIDIKPFWEYKLGRNNAAPKSDIPSLALGQTFEVDCYESGRYRSPIPDEAFGPEAGLWGTGKSGLTTHLLVYNCRPIAPIEFSPADFVDRQALLSGSAENRKRKAYITGHGWQLLVDPSAPWPKDIAGKLVEGRGTVRSDANGLFRLQDAKTNLVRLEDQVGRQVALRGLARSTVDHWWLVYRETEIYVENMEKLPGWSYDQNWKQVLIRGRLEKSRLPRIDQVNREAHPDLVDCFIVRDASWEPIDALLGPERLPVSK